MSEKINTRQQVISRNCNDIRLIKRIEIQNLFGKFNIEWDLNSVSILVGKNGIGKTTLLSAIYSAFHMNERKGENNPLFDKISGMNIIFNNDTSIRIAHNAAVPEIVMKKIVEDFMNNEKLIDALSAKGKITRKELSEKLLEQLSHPDINKNIVDGLDLQRVKYNYVGIDSRIESLIGVEYISTIYMNANSVNEIRDSSGHKISILDMEMKRALDKFNKGFGKNRTELKKRINHILDSLNDFFKESDKQVQWNADDYNFKYILLNSGKSISFRELSSGEQQLIYLFTKAASLNNQVNILLMDEPELSLHLSWQEKLLDAIKVINPNCQLIVATHSPAIIMDGWMDSFVEMKDIIRG